MAMDLGVCQLRNFSISFLSSLLSAESSHVQLDNRWILPWRGSCSVCTASPAALWVCDDCVASGRCSSAAASTASYKGLPGESIKSCCFYRNFQMLPGVTYISIEGERERRVSRSSAGCASPPLFSASPSILFAFVHCSTVFVLKCIHCSLLVLQFIRSQRCGYRQQDRASHGEFFQLFKTPVLLNRNKISE